jgi:hypothetical protein
VPATPEPPRPDAGHLDACEWCRRYWHDELAAEEWRDSGDRPSVVAGGPLCPLCEGTTYQLRRFVRQHGGAEKLVVAVCYGCGHARGLTEGRERLARQSDDGSAHRRRANAALSGATAARREVARGAAAWSDSAEDVEPERAQRRPDEHAGQLDRLRRVQRWEIAVVLTCVIAGLLLLNAWIWWQRARDVGLF